MLASSVPEERLDLHFDAVDVLFNSIIMDGRVFSCIKIVTVSRAVTINTMQGD